ncbi:MAG TPA: L-2-hydroxyglutarate oxidase [Gaiellaceae bacterium]|nr:L-2-hydroxyglutarate oxidase [Gaiellaceae bacterium]
MSTSRFDVVVVGAGIIGLATARELQRRRPGSRVAVVDKEATPGAHQTSHSSGVVHRGVYYAPGSLKAQLCVEGAVALLAYCDERGIPILRCGKVVVATSADELPRLEELHRRSLANGVPRAELIGQDRLRELEPHVAGVRALHSPETAVVDFARVAAAYAEDVRAAGGELLLGREVIGISQRRAAALVETTGGDVEAERVVVCGGVHADRLAGLTGAPPEPRIVPFRGDYLRLRPDRRHLVRGLVYPVPDPAFPFLGIHTTVRPDGDVWLGPNAVLAFAREGYRRRDVSLRDVRDALRAPGFRRLARGHWRLGLDEMVRDLSTRRFVAAARKLLPELDVEDVLPGPSGIRAQALAVDGTLLDDFVFHESEGVVHVRNAPSPGATSSLAIARVIADRV